MGFDAKVNIWYGFRKEDCDIKELEELVEKTGDVLDKEGNYCLETIYCSGEPIGFGIVIFKHDWDYGIGKFDSYYMDSERLSANSYLYEYCEAHNIKANFDFWIQTDWS